ncbi:MAG TPA: chemotaxis protein CheA [Oleiagrimonas sp.]|nr:chemotaxis protein CheA [Oleiagrimonas sp.]
MDVTEFYDTFFEEAEELLDDMEAQLLNLDLESPDPEMLNAIFRAAHSIKGGAGTFGFSALQHTTHLLENLLDNARRGELILRRDLVDIFLETKDMMHDQLQAYRDGVEPDAEALARICSTLERLAAEELAADARVDADRGEAQAAPVPSATTATRTDAVPGSGATAGGYTVVLSNVAESDRDLLIEELDHLGSVIEHGGNVARYEVVFASAESAADIEAVMCFIVEPEQLDVVARPVVAQAAVADDDRASAEPAPAVAAPAPKPSGKSLNHAPEAGGVARHKKPAESSIRVPVSKVDNIINLVGELIITQSMLDQMTDKSGVNDNDNLLSGINQLQRNARDLQEAVMSVRMVPMDYVFSRFPRLVRDLAGKLDKDVELVTTGRSTELDKSLTERIIDPLTHLVRNSLDHGIEHPQDREAKGKPRTGVLTLSAEHQGGNIVIEVRDDGNGLHRQPIMDKARERGLVVSDAMSDEEVWQLIFAPGFSTAATISDVSGRGVGMDVVKRNIEAMGGHVEILSEPGRSTTTRIVLPLTLAILDGMLVRVGNETFILPVSVVLESLQPREEDLFAMTGGEQLLKVRDEYLPLVPVHAALHVPDAKTDPMQAIAVVVQARGRRYAVLVDDLLGQQQVVVKNLETNYRKVPGISAATILGDGSVALILDVNNLHDLVTPNGIDGHARSSFNGNEHIKQAEWS